MGMRVIPYLECSYLWYSIGFLSGESKEIVSEEHRWSNEGVALCVCDSVCVWVCVHVTECVCVCVCVCVSVKQYTRHNLILTPD